MSLPITDFYSLVPPHLDGTREGEWSTFASDHGMLYLLNADRHILGNIIDADVNIDTDIHFPTEAACHNSMVKYYTSHGMAYPYMDEWRASMTVTPYDNNVVTESQVMEFI